MADRFFGVLSLLAFCLLVVFWEDSIRAWLQRRRARFVDAMLRAACRVRRWLRDLAAQLRFCPYFDFETGHGPDRAFCAWCRRSEGCPCRE